MDSLLALKGNIFFELLFFGNPQIQQVAQYLVQTSKFFVGVFFVLSAIWEFFRENQYQELIFRTVFCLIVFSTYEVFLLQSIQTSFRVSQSILVMGSKDNYLVKSLEKAGYLAKKERGKQKKKTDSKNKIGLWEKLSHMSKALMDDGLSTLVWVATYMAFTLLGMIYTILFSLFYIFLPLQALFAIFAPLKASLAGAFRTYMTLVTTPMMMAVILIVLGGHLDQMANFSDYTFSQNLKGLIQLFLSGLLLLFSIPFAAAFFDGRGIGMASSKLAQVSVGALMTMGLGSVMNAILKTPKKLGLQIFKKGSDTFHKMIPFSQYLPGEQKLSKEKSKRRPWEKEIPYQKRKQNPSPQDSDDKNKKFLVLKETPIKKVLQKIPYTPQRKEKQILEQRAKRLIELGKGGNIDLGQFSKKEKARAIEMARKNPEKNFMRKSVYYSALMSALNQNTTQEQKTQKKHINKRRHDGKNKKDRKKTL